MILQGDRYRPVVALDIDGVLRVEPWDDERGGAVRAHEMRLRRDAYPALFHSHPRWNDAGEWEGTVWFSVKGVSWVHSLLERGVDVRWCTTWQQYANFYFAELLALPALPVIPDLGATPFDSSGEWKARNVSAACIGRPVLWVDDHPAGLAELRSRGDRALTYVHRVTSPSRGITDADLAAMDAWLDLASTPEGHEELRRRRHRSLDRQRARTIRERWGTVEAYSRSRHARHALEQAFPPGSELPDHLLFEFGPDGVNVSGVEDLLRAYSHPENPPLPTVLRLLNTVHQHSGRTPRAAGMSVVSAPSVPLLTGDELLRAPPEFDQPSASTTASEPSGGPMHLDAGQVAQQLGVTVGSVYRKRARGELFSDQRRGHHVRFPSWQFGDDGQSLPGLRDVVLTFSPSIPPDAVTSFMTTPIEELNGLSPAAWLRQERRLSQLLDAIHALRSMNPEERG